MKALLTSLICIYAFDCCAQKLAASDQLAASYFKEAAAASQNQQIWKAKLYGPTLFVDPDTRVTYANEADNAGILKPDGEIFTGVLPKEVGVANTAIVWGGKEWSVILWPLPTGHDDRLSLMLHESFHRIQASVGLPERGPTINHLSTMNGRIYYLLELQALKAALNNPVNDRKVDLENALIFREKRHELFPATFGDERILEMSEGLAEYTGVILGRQTSTIRQHLNNQIDTSGERKSLIRSAAYITGPVYGYLLYEKSSGWTMSVDSNSSFPALIAKFYKIKVPAYPISKGEMAAIEKKYHGDKIIKSEEAKEKIRLETVRNFTDLFTRKPVLTIELIKFNINFNPNNLFDLGDLGTVYPTGEIRDAWGFLQVASPGMVMKDWKRVILSVKTPLDPASRILEGNGWKIALTDGWKVVKVNELHYVLSNK